jgi:hypothetical protein
MVGHAQRLGAGALREMRGEGRPDHVCKGLHSEFQHSAGKRQITKPQKEFPCITVTFLGSGAPTGRVRVQRDARTLREEVRPRRSNARRSLPEALERRVGSGIQRRHG